MEVILFGRVIEVRELHRSKAAYPINVTLFGIVIEVRELHVTKA
jgi:hypothetical protein